MRNTITKSLLALVLTAASGVAMANFHFMKVVEVFPGTAASPNAQYVIIQMYTGGQNMVSGHTVTIFNAAGAVVANGTLTFTSNVGNGADQAKILLGTAQAQTFFTLAPNMVIMPVIPVAGGKACFDSIPVDCVAWGNYTGSMTGIGTPFNAAGGLVSGRATIRRLDIAPPPGTNTTLENADDTDNSANDFVFGTPVPRNNAGAIGTIPSNTCPNGIIEGLEECDDNNMNNNDACSNTCVVQVVANIIFGDSFE